MYNPLAKDQIGANAVAVGTGQRAYQNGATGMEAINVGLWWRAWYKSLTFSFVLLFGAFCFSYSVPGLWWFVGVQVAVTVWVFSLTYVSLIDISPRFRQRLWYRLWAPIQHVFPNVARFWWYLLLLVPFWALMLVDVTSK